MIYKIIKIWFVEASGKTEALEKVKTMEPYSEKVNDRFKTGPGSIDA